MPRIARKNGLFAGFGRFARFWGRLGRRREPVQATIWHETQPERLLLEQQVMRERFPGFRLFMTDGVISWLGDLETNRGSTYTIEVRYPDEFPYKAPQVYPINPVITAYADDSRDRFKHQYPDTRLCLFYPGDKTFSPNTTAAAVVALAATWLFAYESWLESNRTDWPGQEAPDIPV